MAYRRKTYRKKRTFKRRTYKRKSYARRPTVAVKKYVKREIARSIENKSRQYKSSLENVYYPANAANYDTNNTIQLSPGDPAAGAPDILQGVGNGSRVGNKIKIKKATFKGVFWPREYNITNNQLPKPNMVKLVLFYERASPTISPQPRTDFFDFNNSDVSIQGDLSDMGGPSNNPKYRVMASKVFKLGRAGPTTSEIGAGVAEFDNNDFKLNKFITWDVTKYMIQHVIYDDNTATPTTRGLWMQIMASPADGTAGTTGIPINYRYWIDIEYEDA